MKLSFNARDVQRFSLPEGEIAADTAAASLQEARTTAEVQGARELEAAIALSRTGLWGAGIATVYHQRELGDLAKLQQDVASVTQETL